MRAYRQLTIVQLFGNCYNSTFITCCPVLKDNGCAAVFFHRVAVQVLGRETKTRLVW